jgi:hypothetical protein
MELIVPILESCGHGGPVIQSHLAYYFGQNAVFLNQYILTLLVQFLRMSEYSKKYNVLAKGVSLVTN